MMKNFICHLLKSMSFLIVLIALSFTNNLFAVEINIGAVRIVDNGAYDTATAMDVIYFNSVHPTKGFPVPQGYFVFGEVNLLHGGSLVHATDKVVTLTHFGCGRGAAGPGGMLTIIFGHRFMDPLTPVVYAIDGIIGTHNNIFGTLGAGNIVEFQGSVNTNLIVPPALPTRSAPVGPIPVPVPNGLMFTGTHGVMPVFGGPQWVLLGHLDITLGVNGDAVLLPSSAEVGIDSIDFPLPVELTSFASIVNKNIVTLSWVTLSEVNNSRFEIERKSVDSPLWTKVGFVHGNGTSTDFKSYSFIDRNIGLGKYNYRLKQIDFNGNYQFYDLQNEVVIGTPDKFSLSQNYPNPFNPTTKINYDIPKDGIVKITIFDNNGRDINTLVNEFKSAGYYTSEFDGSNLSSGIYYYKIESGSLVATRKMVLLK